MKMNRSHEEFHHPDRFTTPRAGRLALGLAIGVLAAGGCGLSPEDGGDLADEETLGEWSDPLRNASLSGGALTASTVRVDITPSSGAGHLCTGIIIGPRHVLTASHCSVTPGAETYTVRYFSGSTLSGVSQTASRAFVPWGVEPTAGDYIDQNGKFADMMILDLGQPIPAGYQPARLPYYYIGNGSNSYGYMVGNGVHDGTVAGGTSLRYLVSKVYSAANSDGHMLVDSSDVDGGDSGGPFFTWDGSSLTVHGTLYGTAWEWGWRSKYTSVQYHLGRILGAMGVQAYSNYDLPGNDYAAFWDAGLADCQIRCGQDSQCLAYTHVPNVASNPGGPGACWLKNTWGTYVPSAGMTSGFNFTPVCWSSGGFCRI